MNDFLPPPSQGSALPNGIEPEFVYSSEPVGVHLRDYLNVLLKRRRLVASVFLTSVLVGAYISFTATNLYTAKSTLKIEPQNPSVTGVGEMLRLDSPSPYDYFQTQFKLLESRTLAAKVIKELDLESNKTFKDASAISSNIVSRVKSSVFGAISAIASLFPSAPQPSSQIALDGSKSQSDLARLNSLTKGLDVKASLVNRYSNFLTVKPIKNTRLVEVEFTTPDPYLSQTLANAHARGFIRLSLEARFEITREAREFLDTKQNELRAKLERAEQALNQFRQEHGVVSMDKGENIVVERLVDLNKQLTGAQAQRIEAESLYRTVASKPVQNLSQVITQGLVPTIRSNLQTLEAEKVKLSAIFKPEHPRLIELSQQIAETKRALNTEIGNVVRGIEEAFFAARAKEQALQAEADRQQQRALNLKEIGVQYAVLEEDVKVNRTLYDGVLKRLNETHVSNDIAVSNIQIAQQAERPFLPSSPDIPFNFIVSAFLGLFLGAGLAFLFDYFDSTVGTPHQVWQSLTLNTFGVVPNFYSLGREAIDWNRPAKPLMDRLTQLRLPPPSRSMPSSKELVVAHHPLSVVAESYRAIRTSLLFHQVENPPRVMLLTSPAPGDGKTVTVLNLAIALAQDGHNVLVIDGDMRKGCCHVRMGLRNHVGLSNVLTGQVSYEQAVQATGIQRLFVLTRGNCPPNPSELVGTRRMRQLLSGLREKYDYILIDSPPVIAVSDTAILATICEGVLLVLHSKNSTLALARQALERLASVKAKVLGTILNSINLANPDYAYYRHYHEYHPDFSGEENSNGNPKDDIGQTQPKWAFPQAQPANGTESVSQEFVERIVSELTEAVGPMASLIVRDQIEILGEPQHAFPKSRLGELVDRICEEILDENLKKRFQSSMAESFRALGTSTGS